MIPSRRLLLASVRAARSARRSASNLQPSALVARTTSTQLVTRISALRYFSADPKGEDPAKEEDSKGTEKTEDTKNEAKAKAFEPPIPPGEQKEFLAETRQLLDIVTHSLYTDKEVFLRELVSNASDSLEKLRHLQATNQLDKSSDDDVPLEIRIDLDEVTSTLTISDTGVGMTRDELIDNLGTIARSGSKSFVKAMQEARAQTGDAERGIIGKFGVGFYSSFMVGKKVEVRSKSAFAPPEQRPMIWSSDGSGTYQISELPDGIRQDRGSAVVIHFKEENWDFVDENRIETVLKKYSNFVNFPILLNGKKVNTLEAIWSMDPKDVSKEDYTAFYKYIAGAQDEPFETIHFRADAPVDIKALFFIPQFHNEKYGMERMRPGVSIYSRKVLIESQSPDILPDWLRFLKGVVDSEDLPLAISREKPQDSALIGKLRKTLTRKFVAHMEKMAKKEKDRYVTTFYKEYGFFMKEGICHDLDAQRPLSKLLYFETSKPAEEKGGTTLVSFDEYISRMRPEQKGIYYLVSPSRETAVSSPYLEAFEKAGVEVLFCFSSIEEFVMANLEKYEGRELVSIERSDIDLTELAKNQKDKDGKDKKDEEADNMYAADRKLTPDESLDFCNWFQMEVGEKKVGSCTVTDRLSSSPAIISDHESGAMRRMVRMVDASDGNREAVPLPKQHVEINPKHAIIVGINSIRDSQPVLARVLAEQVYDNCLVAAGVLDDARSMLPRLNDILVGVVKDAQYKAAPEAQAAKTLDEEARLEEDAQAKAAFTEVMDSDITDVVKAAEMKKEAKEESENEAVIKESVEPEIVEGASFEDKVKKTKTKKATTKESAKAKKAKA